MNVTEKFDRNIHTNKLNDDQFTRFEVAEAEAEAKAESGSFPRFGYSTNQTFETAEEWLNWKLFQIVEQLENE